jgi:cyclopropane-fatty-acyl-phospholipid synthase
MNAQAPTRGAELIAGGRKIGVGPQWLARLWSGGINAILDRIDTGLERGSLELTLPDGSTRLLGGRQDGFACDVRLNNARALLRLATGGSVGWYQAWEAEEWESRDPVALFALFMDNARSLGNAARARGPWRLIARLGHWLKRNTRTGSLKNIHAHYDLGNDFYATWLDPTLNYSSGIFGGEALSLEEAQHRKMEAITRRLSLPPQASVLEIGCGWGSLAEHMASRQGASVRAISLSDEQLAYARESRNGAPGSVDFQKCDYRDVTGQFDAIASVEMVEAVGRAYWPDFLDCVARCLKPGGRAAIQYISIDDAMFDAYAASADFIQAYVFPGGMLLRESEFRSLAEARGLSWQDQSSIGQDYAETLRIWRENFDSAVEGGRLPPGFDEHFVRLWRYYLMYCEGGFRGGGIDVAQVTLVKS